MAIGASHQKAGAVGAAVSLTGVTAGNLIVVMVTWWDDAGAPNPNSTPTLSDANNAPDGYSAVITNGTQQSMRFAYWLSSPKSGSVTYTWTHTQTVGGSESLVFEVSHDNALTLDTVDAGATGNSGTATSASETSAETSMVAFGGMGSYNQNTFSSATLDGVAVDQNTTANDTTNQDFGAMTMRVMNNPGSYTSVINVGTSAPWCTDVIAFKEAAAVSGTPFFTTLGAQRI